jgi:hypothetical protein
VSIATLRIGKQQNTETWLRDRGQTVAWRRHLIQRLPHRISDTSQKRVFQRANEGIVGVFVPPVTGRDQVAVAVARVKNVVAGDPMPVAERLTVAADV